MSGMKLVGGNEYHTEIAENLCSLKYKKSANSVCTMRCPIFNELRHARQKVDTCHEVWQTGLHAIF